jgi:hypothetical protein
MFVLRNARISLHMQPAKASSILRFMQSQGIAADDDSYDLLIRAHVAAGDMAGAREALLQLRRAGGRRARLATAKEAATAAARLNHPAAL